MTRGRRAVAATFTVLAAVLVAGGAYSVVLAGTCESDPPPGVRECSPAVVASGFALAAGILLAVGVAAVFGYGAAFAAAFLGAGAGVTGAAIRGAGDGRLWGLLLGVPFLVIGGAMLEAGPHSSPTRRAASLRDGRRGTATVLAVEETRGLTAPGRRRVRERVRVVPADGGPYESERTRLVEEPPMIGERYAVRIDPADPHHWTEDA